MSTPLNCGGNTEVLTEAEADVLWTLRVLSNMVSGGRAVRAAVIMAEVHKAAGWEGGTTRNALRTLMSLGLAKRVARGYYRPEGKIR